MPNDQERDSAYEQLFVKFSDPVERWLRRIALVLLLLLFVVQALLKFPQIRQTMTRTGPLEGEPLVQKNHEIP